MGITKIEQLARIIRTIWNNIRTHLLIGPLSGRNEYGLGNMNILLWYNNSIWVSEHLNLTFIWGTFNRSSIIEQSYKKHYIIFWKFSINKVRDKAILFYHIQMWDQLSRCTCYYTCLTQINDWSNSNPDHFPLYESFIIYMYMIYFIKAITYGP